MKLLSKFRFVREGRWRLWLLEERWSPKLLAEVRRRIEGSLPGGHPLTQRFSLPAGGREAVFYLKVYGGSDFLGSLKDLARDSKAFRALKQSERLAGCGFGAPQAVAAGEERRWGILRLAFLVTLGVEGSLLPHDVQERYAAPLDASRLRMKREYLRQLGREIRRLHRSGFVHGDLVPYNILVRQEGGRVRFFFLDNDRTRRYPAWLPQTLWKRNLVQLNRFALPGISLQDRLRFLRAYLEGRPWGRRQRRVVLSMEKRTRKRWARFLPPGAPISFRRLMRWDEPVAKNTPR